MITVTFEDISYFLHVSKIQLSAVNVNIKLTGRSDGHRHNGTSVMPGAQLSVTAHKGQMRGEARHLASARCPMYGSGGSHARLEM